jgi:hypothetical protein
LSTAKDLSIRADIGCVGYMSCIGYPTATIGMLVSRNWSIAEIELGHDVVSRVDRCRIPHPAPLSRGFLRSLLGSLPGNHILQVLKTLIISIGNYPFPIAEQIPEFRTT